MSWRDQVVSEAMTWLGTKYHHKGRVKGQGVDCGGLIYEVYKKVLGIPVAPFPSHYAEDWGLHKDNNEKYLDFIMPYVKPTNVPQLADLVIFKFGRAFAHGTLYCGRNRVIHAYGRTGHGSVIISDLGKFQTGGHIREYKIFTLDEKWLSSAETH